MPRMTVSCHASEEEAAALAAGIFRLVSRQGGGGVAVGRGAVANVQTAPAAAARCGGLGISAVVRRLLGRLMSCAIPGGGVAVTSAILRGRLRGGLGRCVAAVSGITARAWRRSYPTAAQILVAVAASLSEGHGCFVLYFMVPRIRTMPPPAGRKLYGKMMVQTENAMMWSAEMAGDGLIT